MAKPFLRFQKNPKYPHQRSEGTTHRGQARIERLLRWDDSPTNRSENPVVTAVPAPPHKVPSTAAATPDAKMDLTTANNIDRS